MEAGGPPLGEFPDLFDGLDTHLGEQLDGLVEVERELAFGQLADPTGDARAPRQRSMSLDGQPDLGRQVVGQPVHGIIELATR